MKLKAFYFILFFGLFFSAAGFAQVNRNIGSDQYKRTTNKTKQPQKDVVERATEYYTKELKLDDFQAAAVKDIFKSEKDNMESLQGPGKTQEERRDKAAEIYVRVDNKVLPLLTAEQKEKYKEMQGKRKL
jgi:Spy/CpxP family protein refolding chaperone